MKASQLKKKPKHFYSFTGLRAEWFETLREAIKRELDAAGRTPRPRQRAPGGGRKARLGSDDQVLVILMYYRLYVTQVLLGYLFDLGDSNVSRLIGRLRPLLLGILPLSSQETLFFNEDAGWKHISSLEELLEKHPDIKEALVDAPEQEVQKPNNKRLRKGNGSGKKEHHTLKTQVCASVTGLLLHVIRPVPGRLSDHNLLRGMGLLRDLPANMSLRLDRGYDGMQNDFPDRN